MICGGAVPSHRAVAEFIRRHRPEIKRLFVQVLSLLAAEGAVQGYTAEVDGSPVSGNASRFREPGCCPAGGPDRRGGSRDRRRGRGVAGRGRRGGPAAVVGRRRR